MSLVVAASMSTVEALKDQVGLCRWNYGLRALQQQVKNNLRSVSQARRSRVDEKARESEESLKKVMFLSYWGPY